MIKKVIISSLLGICIQVSLHAQSPINEQLTNKLDSIFQKSSIVGFGTAIYTKDKLIYRNAFGLASKENNIKYTTNTRQKIASISKLLLGVSVMKAQELGFLRLDDNVNKYLPFKLTNPYSPETSITIRHLASHTGGLVKLPKYDHKALYFPSKIPGIKKEMPFGLKKLIFNKILKKLNANKELSLEEFLTNLYSVNGKWYSKKHFLKATAGTKAVYSNSGASLLALAIEKSSGMAYGDFVQQYIIDPIGLKNSLFDFQKKPNKQKTADYYHSGLHINNDYKLLLYPAGGFESSVDDFYQFMQVIVKDLNGANKLLSKASTMEMLTPQFDTEHGFLWEVYPDGEIGHRGDIIGVTTFAYYNVKKDKGYLVFFNTGGTNTLGKETYEIRKILKSYFDKNLSDHE